MTTKTKRMNIPVEQEIKTMWEKAARRKGYQSTSAWMRLVLTEEARKVLNLTR